MAWLTEVEKAYLAGIIDGEGSIGISRDYRPNRRHSPFHRARMRITSTNLDLIEYLKTKVGDQGKYHICTRPSRDINRKTTYEIEMGDRLTAKLLHEVLPYLIVKRKHAENVLAFKETFEGFNRGKQIPMDIIKKRENYFLMQKELNHRGVMACLG